MWFFIVCDSCGEGFLQEFADVISAEDTHHKRAIIHQFSLPDVLKWDKIFRWDADFDPDSEVAGVISWILTMDFTDLRMHQTVLVIHSNSPYTGIRSIDFQRNTF